MHVISLLRYIQILFKCIYITLQECVLVYVCEEEQKDSESERAFVYFSLNKLNCCAVGSLVAPTAAFHEDIWA